MTPKLEPFPDYGDLMTLQDWLIAAERQDFIDYDGSGSLATKDGISNIDIKPSQASTYKFPDWVTHIVWFNR